MGWGSALIGLLSSLPQLLVLLAKFMAWFKQVAGEDPQQFVKDIGIAFDQLNASKTAEERQNAAKALAGVIARL